MIRRSHRTFLYRDMNNKYRVYLGVSPTVCYCLQLSFTILRVDLLGNSLLRCYGFSGYRVYMYTGLRFIPPFVACFSLIFIIIIMIINCLDLYVIDNCLFIIVNISTVQLQSTSTKY